MNVLMYLLYFVFEEVTPADRATDQQAGGSSAARGAAPSTPIVGVLACIFFFFVHFNGFAVQETITTPLIKDWFGWGDVGANLLFTAAGAANLLCAVVMSVLSGPRVAADGTVSQLVDDRTLLLYSLALALLGWLLMVPPAVWGLGGSNPGPSDGMGLPQFGVAFALVTVACRHHNLCSPITIHVRNQRRCQSPPCRASGY